VAHDGMWIYIDPPTAYLDARIGEQFDGIIFIRDHAHPPDRERPKNHGRARRGLLAWTPHHSRQHAVGSDLASFWSSGSRQVRLTLPSSASTPWCPGSETPAFASETRTECRGRAKVSNELSNYCGADRQPRMDDPGSLRAPGLGIADHLACFTPKQFETYAWFLRIASRTLL
jgi:hypothetical protein